MKKALLHLTLILFLVMSTGLFVAPKKAEAACIFTDALVKGSGSFLQDCANDFINLVVLPISAKVLQISAWFFDFSLRLNLQIGTFTGGKPGTPSTIEQVWLILRDFSSIIFIAALLWAGFSMVIGSGTSKASQVIVQVVIAGLLMNFSLFITRTAIDASNTVALMFYNAINAKDNTSAGDIVSISEYGGISGPIMDTLRIQTIYSATKENGALNFTVNSILIVLGGSVMMIIAAVSFFTAAVMFVFRFVILVMLMAFSPIWVVSRILPQLKSQAEMWEKALIGQCLFAPIYLLVMYIGLRILTDPHIASLFAQGSLADILSTATIRGKTPALGIGPLLGYGISIFFMYQALIVAEKFGGKGASYGKSITNKVGELAAYFPKRVVGGAAKKINKGLDSSLQSNFVRNNPVVSSATKYLYGNSRLGQTIRGATTDKLLETKWGGTKSYKDEVKIDKELAAKDRAAATSREIKDSIEAYNKAIKMSAGPVRVAALEAQSKKLKEALEKKTSAELAKLPKETLIDPAVLLHLSGKVYDTIQKASSDEHSDADKVAIAAAREKFLSNTDPGSPIGAAVQEARASGNVTALKTLMKSLGDKDDKSDVAVAVLSDELKLKTPNLELIRAILKEVKKDVLTKTIEDSLRTIADKTPAPSDDLIDILLRNVQKDDFNLFDQNLLLKPNISSMLNAEQLKSLSNILTQSQKVSISKAVNDKANNGGFPHAFDYIFDPKNNSNWPRQ